MNGWLKIRSPLSLAPDFQGRLQSSKINCLQSSKNAKEWAGVRLKSIPCAPQLTLPKYFKRSLISAFNGPSEDHKAEISYLGIKNRVGRAGAALQRGGGSRISLQQRELLEEPLSHPWWPLPSFPGWGGHWAPAWTCHYYSLCIPCLTRPCLPPIRSTDVPL